MSGLTKDLGNRVLAALGEIGCDTETRESILSALVAWEERNKSEGDDVRERVVAPIVDALHKKIGTVARELIIGISFSLPYQSKIAREFALGTEPLSHIWEPQTTRLLLELGRQSEVAVIGGAYAGDHAVPIAHAMRQSESGGSCHCFELQPAQINALTANAAQNGLPNLIVNRLGLWDRPGFVKLVGDDSHAAPEWMEHERNGQEGFPVTTISEYAKQRGIKKIDIIMLDIEGGEAKALQGAAEFLQMQGKEAPHLVFEVHSNYVDWSDGLHNTEIIKMLIEVGYDVYALRDYQGNVNMGNLPIEVIPADSVYLDGPAHGFNMFATKDSAAIESLNLQLRHNVSPKLLRHRFTELHQPGK